MADRITSLSGLDASFLYLEGLGTPMHIGSCMLLTKPRKRGYDFHESVMDLMAERMPAAKALRRVLQPTPLELAHPVWIDRDSIDLEEHILKRKMRAPGSDTALQNLIAKLHAEQLPRDKPLWRFYVIDGHHSGQPILYTKIHHALLDGQGGVALAKLMLDLEPRIPPQRHAAEPVEEKRTRKRDVAQAGARSVFDQFSRLLRAVPETIKVAASGIGELRTLPERLKEAILIAPKTPFNAQIGAERSFAMFSLPLDRVKQLAKVNGVSLNDVVLELVGATLRDYLKRRGELPDEPLIVAMPVSLRTEGDGASNNQASMVQCSLATNIADPVERLRLINEATRGIKGRLNTYKHLIPTDFPGLAAPLWATGLSRLWAMGKVSERLPPLANVVISNVPGPPIPLYLAGCELQHLYPVSIVTHGLALNFTLHSYRNSLDFGLIASRDQVPKLDGLARGLEKALDQLSDGLSKRAHEESA